ncbi:MULTISPECIES: Fe(3+) ABC transporter substrate-binding protein [Gammaproteobacteria]|uniref:Fe(3+) ABC transporter substrate-binding protein n=1 Tax=Gammaproteobacteria TaxID=1236 RepID=UPI000DD0C8FE|nr:MULTISPECIES: Fe(3+) ABC transporter substrate-binding protein [Gammaproteobacteria]RTE87725.1 Fe(3+) ABC transporter substrate-binding protein [Aliidiomarina sp. B3213]TCZ92493.1 Fe(3+) ABC transporter substrate-binding protein [Lysobacter sp. N42]
MKPIFKIILAVLIIAGLILTLKPNNNEESSVNIYSSRKESLIKPLLEKFTEETGIQVNLVTGSGDGLLTRLQNEGENSPADLFLTVDAGALHRAKSASLFQPVDSRVLNANVPAHLQDADQQWFGLSMRARTIFYSNERVEPSELSTYMDLADEKWRNRICIRSSDNLYNQSLVASLIAHHGEAATEEWARGLVANFAREPVGGDRDQIHAVASGQCDIAIANTYYFGGMTASDEAANQETVSKVNVFWPSQSEQGVHVNVSGIGLLQHASNPDEAIQLMEFLVSEESQAWYAEANQEYPVRPGTDRSEILTSWGDFEADTLSMSVLGENNAAAVRLMNRAGWR